MTIKQFTLYHAYVIIRHLWHPEATKLILNLFNYDTKGTQGTKDKIMTPTVWHPVGHLQHMRYH